MPAINLQQPSIMPVQHDFSKGPRASITRSVFKRDHMISTGFNAGYLIPIWRDEALPGDTIQMQATAFGRLTTPFRPFLTPVHLDLHFFACPNRLLWDNWERFNGAQDDPGDSTAFVTPKLQMPAAGFVAGTIYDYFKYPLGVANTVVGDIITAFWARMYNLTFNQWYRDENLQDSVTVNRGNGPDALTDCVLLRRGKRHDYFTACLPSPQKGPSVPLVLGTSAPVVSTADDVTLRVASDAGTERAWVGQMTTNDTVIGGAALGADSFIRFGTVTGLETDLSSAISASVNTFIQSMQLQGLLVRDNVGGTRYIELILAHFGVQSDDARLQRVEYLGGSSTELGLQPVTQNAPAAGASTPLGNLAATGTFVGRGGFTKSFTEHCTLLGIISARADLVYHQGIERMDTRSTRFDYYWPALAHLGEQAVLNREIFHQDSTVSADVFGYIPRYDEYRYKQSGVTGPMRPTTAGTGFGDQYTLCQHFTALPVLDDPAFIQENPPVSRVVISQTEPQFLVDVYFKQTHTRPMPVTSVPATLSRF